MNHIEEYIEELESYKPAITKQKDHDEFWEETLHQVKSQSLGEEVLKIDYPIKEIEAYKITYQGFDETPIHGYYIIPKKVEEKLPCLIFFHSYMGNKKSVSDYMMWLIQGYAVIAIDVRGQGKTGDHSRYSSDALGSWVTKGILDKEEYYYRKVYMDGVRAVDFACSREEVDSERIGLMGASMGGGITLAVAALDDRPKLAVADIPNMCDLGLAMQQKFEGSLTFVENFLHRYPQSIDRVYETLSYFDNLNLIEKVSCKTRMSMGLKDLICPPQPIFGVYNHLSAPKSLEIYPFPAMI